MRVLVHDGFGVWLGARRLNQGSSTTHPTQRTWTKTTSRSPTPCRFLRYRSLSKEGSHSLSCWQSLHCFLEAKHQ
ncbi:hypothetical protein [Pseudomonas avellanae]